MQIYCDIANKFFAKWIGKISHDLTFLGDIKLLDTVQQLQALKSFKNTVFLSAEFLQAHSDIEFFRSHCILLLQNNICTEWNNGIVNNLQKDLNILDLVDYILDETVVLHQLDFLFLKFFWILKTAFLVLAQLCLKLGVPVILLQNLTPSEKMCNGTRLWLTYISRFILKDQILHGKRHGKKQPIPRIFINITKRGLPRIITQKQFSICLYFAITVNKLQRQFLDMVRVDLESLAFTHGQLYVTFSWITNVSKLCIFFLKQRDKITSNVIYFEVFLQSLKA